MLSPLVLLRDLHAHTSKSEWMVYFGCTLHMAKDASLFSPLSKATKEEIFVVDDYALTLVDCGRIECHNGVITDVYHVPSLSANSLSVPQLT